MLYATTRNNRDTFTAYHALTENRAADGGHYVPFRMPVFSPEEIETLAEKPFNQTVADILNLLFQTQLSKWDVDFAAGRYPVRMVSMNHRITVAESWHNLDWEFSRMVQNLTAQLRGTRDTEIAYSEWTAIAVRIAVLFATFGERMRQGTREKIDIAVPSGDFSMVMSAWYARAWGLPIGNIVCCCNENNNLWELIYHGVLRTDAVARPTTTPKCDLILPPHLERLIAACGEEAEMEYFQTCCREGRSYYPSDDALSKMRKGLHVSVVGQKRLQSTIPNAYATHGYVYGPYSALAYAGLLDYRAKTGESGHALILSEQGALCDDAFVASAMGKSIEDLHQLLQ